MEVQDNKDIYQERYLEHKKNKFLFLVEENSKYSLDVNNVLELMKNRRSQRTFNQQPIAQENIDMILQSVALAPSSCNRQAIYLKEYSPIDVEKMFVGGRLWSSSASKAYLILGAKQAYKNPIEQSYMPYIDCGTVVENIYLICESLHIGCCFINPNIKEEYKEEIKKVINDDYLCGVIVLGYYDKKALAPKKRSLNEVIKND